MRAGALLRSGMRAPPVCCFRKRLNVGGVAAPWLGTVVAHLPWDSADRVRDERGNATVAAPAAPVCGEDVP